VRIVVCNDGRLLLESLSRALQLKGFTVVATSSTPAEAVAAVRLYTPDVLLSFNSSRRWIPESATNSFGIP
jgi:DNA-binding NarL/FixJ family response regulator